MTNPENNPTAPAVDADRVRDELAQALVSGAPPDWAEIHLVFRGSSTICQEEVTGSTLSGGTLLMPPPPDSAQRLKQLRAAMYEPGRGTWFSAVITVKRNDEAAFVFNYTDDPHWTPVSPAVFTLDQERFPRDEQHIPAWLRQKLAEGAAAEREHARRRPDDGSV